MSAHMPKRGLVQGYAEVTYFWYDAKFHSLQYVQAYFVFSVPRVGFSIYHTQVYWILNILSIYCTESTQNDRYSQSSLI